MFECQQRNISVHIQMEQQANIRDTYRGKQIFWTAKGAQHVCVSENVENTEEGAEVTREAKLWCEIKLRTCGNCHSSWPVADPSECHLMDLKLGLLQNFETRIAVHLFQIVFWSRTRIMSLTHSIDDDSIAASRKCITACPLHSIRSQICNTLVLTRYTSHNFNPAHQKRSTTADFWHGARGTYWFGQN